MTAHQLFKVLCRTCKVSRWDDGLKCPNCGEYQNPKVGKMVRPPDTLPYWHRVDK